MGSGTAVIDAPLLRKRVILRCHNRVADENIRSRRAVGSGQPAEIKPLAECPHEFKPNTPRVGFR